MIRALFPPIPPEIESGAGVFDEDPMLTPVSWSEVSVSSPVPLGVRVRESSLRVVIVAADPPPSVSVVESIEREGAASIVVSAPALIVVRPEATRVVSDAAMVRVLSPESRVKVFAPWETIDPTPTNVSESMSRTDPSIEILPRSALSLMVIDPVPAATSNSVKSIAVAPPFIDVRDVPLIVVVLVRFSVWVLSPSIDPAAPLRGDILMFPVVSPPMVRVLFLRDCRVEVAAVRERPLLLVVAERVATGVPFETFVIAN